MQRSIERCSWEELDSMESAALRHNPSCMSDIVHVRAERARRAEVRRRTIDQLTPEAIQTFAAMYAAPHPVAEPVAEQMQHRTVWYIQVGAYAYVVLDPLGPATVSLDCTVSPDKVEALVSEVRAAGVVANRLNRLIWDEPQRSLRVPRPRRLDLLSPTASDMLIIIPILIAAYALFRLVLFVVFP